MRYAEQGPLPGDTSPISASKCSSAVNQSCGENSKWGIVWLRTHGEFEAVSPEKDVVLILSCFWGSGMFGKSSSLPAK